MITTTLNDQNHISENCIRSVISFFIFLTQVPFVYMERAGLWPVLQPATRGWSMSSQLHFLGRVRHTWYIDKNVLHCKNEHEDSSWTCHPRVLQWINLLKPSAKTKLCFSLCSHLLQQTACSVSLISHTNPLKLSKLQEADGALCF